MNRTEQAWRKGTLVEPEYLGLVYGRQAVISGQCTCCGSPKRESTIHKTEIREHEEGDMCLRCWISAPACSRCGQLRCARYEIVCRSCYMGKDIVPVLEDFIWRKVDDDEPTKVNGENSLNHSKQKEQPRESDQEVGRPTEHNLRLRRVLAGFSRLSDLEYFQKGEKHETK